MKAIRLCAALLCALGFIVMMAATTRTGFACTRAVYFGKDGQTVTGRTMDWLEDMQTNLWIFPRGMERGADMGPKALRWTSKYGSVIASGYESGTADGMNEKGLVVNMLYLAESKYPPEDDRPTLVTGAWAQYVLDNFATVGEAVEELLQDKFRVITVAAPNGSKGTVHFAISDSSGDSAIIEYINGLPVIHHGREYQVLTNSPVYDEQQALYAYWKQIGGTVMLPGTNRAADRFARASFYINAAAQSADPREAVAAVFSVMRNASVPRGISTPAQPNISSTIWRTVADQKNRIYFFEDTASPGVLWMKLNAINFQPGSGARKLAVHGHHELGGDQTANFKKAKPFKFLSPH